MSRSAESEAPIAFSCSRRWPRSSAPVGSGPAGESQALGASIDASYLMQTARTCLMSVTPARHFSMPSCFRVRMPSSRHCGEHLGDARVLLDQLLQLVGGDQQLVQAACGPCSPCRRTCRSPPACRSVSWPLSLPYAFDPVLVHRLHRALGVGLEARGVHAAPRSTRAGTRSISAGVRRVGLLAAAQALAPGAAPGCRAARRRS